MADLDLLLVAGEESGDLHGDRVLEALGELLPGLRPFGLGGDRMQARGLDAVAHSSEISVVGLTEVLRVLPRARRIFHRILEEVERRSPAAAVLIDSPGFNLRLARALERRGVRVIYYVSPQVWAWHRSRVHTIARVVDRMLVLFPFEVDFYRRHDVEVVHVGHPLVDEVPLLPHVWDREPQPQGPFRIALMPGSRRGEVERLLPPMLGAARRIAARHPARFSLIRAAGISAALLERHVDEAGLPVEVVSQERYRTLASCHLALCASGTATLEVGLIGTPMVMVYRLSLWTYLLGRLLVRLPHMSLVNLVLEAPVVPELIQRQASPGSIGRAAIAILGDRERVQQMRARLSELRSRLGASGASRRAAAEIASILEHES